MTGGVDMGDGDLVFSVLSLMTKEVIGDTGIEVTNKGVSRVVIDVISKQHICMDLSVKFLKHTKIAKSVMNILRRWLNKKVSSITSAKFTIIVSFNEDDGVYETVVTLEA